jgi:DnaK suppressor protein
MRRQTDHGEKRMPQAMRTTNHVASRALGTDYRAMLLASKSEVLSNLGMKFDALASAGRVAEEDQAQFVHDEFISLSLNHLEYQKLRQVQEALDRLDSGDYGTCPSCEEPIHPKRLSVIPWAKYCIKCQDRIAAEQSDASRSEQLQLVEH